MKKNLLFLRLIFFGLVMLFSSGWVMGQTLDDYRSAQTGTWNSTATWERYDGASWVAAVSTPTSANGAITIQNGHTVTISAAGLSYDQVTVDAGGQVTVASTITSTLANGTGTDLVINGIWLHSGGTWTVTGAQWSVGSGGTYIHNTTSSASTPISVATLDANSTVIYRGSSTLVPAISISGRTYGHLSFESTSGSWSSATLTGSTATSINGNFTLGSNVTLTMSYTGILTFAGNYTLNGTLTYSTGNQNFTFTGSGKTISGSGTISFEMLNIYSGASITCSNAVTLLATFTGTVTGTLATAATFTNNGTLNVNGTFQINEGGWATGTDFVYGAAGTLVFNNSSGSYGVNNDAFWANTNGPVNVSVSGAGGITMNFARTITGTFQTAAAVVNANNLTLNGTAQINTGGSFSSSPTYGSGSTLIYNTGGTYGRGSEWSSTNPANITLSNNTTLNYPNGSNPGAKSITGNLTIESGSALYMDYGSPGTNGALTVGGNLTLAGSLSLGDAVGGDLKVGGNWTNNSGTFNTNSREVEFNGSSSQSIAGSSATTFAYLKIDNSSGVNLSSSTTVSNTLTLTNGALSIGSNTLTLNGDISSTSGTLTGGSSSNITFGGSGVTTIPAISGGLNNLTINRTDALTLGSQNQLTVAGTLTNNAGGNFVVQSDASYSGSLIISGTYSGTGTFTYKRHMPDANFHMLGSPLGGQTINSTFLSNNGINAMKHYIEGNDNWINPEYVASPPNTTFTLAKGYATRLNAIGTIDLIGAPNTAAVSDIALTRTNFGWNLLSNPFTSAIAANAQGDATNNLISINSSGVLDINYTALYIWDGTAYKIINHASGSPTASLEQNYLQVGQGFFVKSKLGGGTFSITPAMQSHQTGIAFKSNPIQFAGIVLNAEKNTSKISTQISYKEGMNRGLDIGYDAGLMKSNPSFALYSRLVEDNGVDFGIQCLPAEYDDLVVPIGLDAKSGDIIKFTAQSFNLPEEYNVYLEDRVLGIYTNLSPVDASYNTQLLSDSKGTGRFFVRTSMESALGIGNLDNGNPFKVFTRSNHNQIVIHGEANANTIARIYSISGKQIISYSLKQGTENLVQFNEEAGVYIVKISNEQGTYTQKFGWLK